MVHSLFSEHNLNKLSLPAAGQHEDRSTTSTTPLSSFHLISSQTQTNTTKKKRPDIHSVISLLVIFTCPIGFTSLHTNAPYFTSIS